MSTLSTRKIKHDSSSVDNITLNSNGSTSVNSLSVINSASPTSWVSVDAGLTTHSMYLQANTTSGDVRVGSYTNHPFGLYTNNVERLRIDTSGRITTPNQPTFYAYTNNSTMNSSSKVLFDQAPINIGNYFNTTTNTFTAPIAGLYYFSAVVRYNQIGVTYSQTQIYVNGGNIFQGHYSNTTNAASTYSGVPAVTVVSLAAGDTVNVYAVISGGGSFTYSGAESCFFGWLMG